ncbi:MAG: hypothetical protein LH645_05860 [Actinomycetia bacterium]|nr:hypothetical protein [Actinomycetes bacterium]
MTFLIPTSILLLLCIQMREGQTRRLRASRLVYRDKYNPERRRMLAMRAVVSLPADHLLKLSPDPIGDLVRGEHDALVAAMLSEAGLAPAALPAD